MLRSFEERERVAEMLFARAEEMHFVTHCYAVRALAAFAVGRLGVDSQTSEAYARLLIAEVIEGLDDEALLMRVQGDLAANGVSATLDELRGALMGAAAQAASAAGLVVAQLSRRPRLRAAMS
ncbi:ATPase inhibitor subunit zeta [Methylobacterium durans]|uniref:ATPase inhibitor subunit zeta n=1 Tax=Methylobacterium durans TaxID=2202825 RepID=UPI002AFF0EEE|nr:ATPase inhibitor subunit zeta [Methylobacterium durans]MEA1834397.1 ATPase inhibitor subunit zeta [Methylobacterium durans]